jgi:hypothetical protein
MNIRLIRQESGAETRIEKVYNIEDIEKRRAEDIVLQANDMIDVPGAKGIGRSLLRIFAPTVTQLPLQIIRPY